MISRQRLRRGHVQRRHVNTLLVECANQASLIDSVAAGDIAEDGGAFHATELLVGEHVARFGSQGHDHAHEIALGEHVIELSEWVEILESL